MTICKYVLFKIIQIPPQRKKAVLAYLTFSLHLECVQFLRPRKNSHPHLEKLEFHNVLKHYRQQIIYSTYSIYPPFKSMSLFPATSFFLSSLDSKHKHHEGIGKK